MIEVLRVCGRVLTIIKFMYVQKSAGVKTSAGLSEILRCMLGVKQGCPLSPTLFGLYVYRLEKHLLQTSGIDAPELIGKLIPLLLYAHDLVLMSTRKEGLQRQIDALAESVQVSSWKLTSLRPSLWCLKPDAPFVPRQSGGPC